MSDQEYDDDLPTNADRDWVRDFGRLMRWLRARDYHDLARGLFVNQVRELEGLPTIDAELEVLDGALQHLYFLLNSPPEGLSTEQGKEFRRLNMAAIQSARMMRHLRLPERRERRNSAIATVDAHMKAARKQAVESDTEIEQTFTQPPEPTMPDPPWIKQGPLGLTLNTNDRAAIRNATKAEFGESGRAWDVFVKLVDRYPSRYAVRELGRAVWNPIGVDDDPGDNLVHKAVGTIRRKLEPLGLYIPPIRTLGYVLTDSEPAAKTKKGLAATKTASRRSSDR